MRLILPVVLALTAACAGSLESGLRDARDASSVPVELRVYYDDHDALLGGDRIEITGDGQMRIWRFRPGFVSASDSPEQSLGDVEIETSPSDPPTEERTLSAEDLTSLVRVLLEVAPWEQVTEQDETRLDRRRAVLRATLRGASGTCWEWVDETESDASRIRKFLRWARTHGALPSVDVPAPPAEPAEPGAPAPEDG